VVGFGESRGGRREGTLQRDKAETISDGSALVQLLGKKKIREKLYFWDSQCGSDFDKMSLTDTINLQDAFH
jgi:hypothetical protein